MTKNILHCLNHGIQMGGLIDPEEQTIFVYLPNQQLQVFDQAEQLLTVPAFASDLNPIVGAVFGWLAQKPEQR